MAAITTTGTLTAGNSRTFALAPGSALTLTLLPNCRVTVTETPETVSASDAGGNSPRTHNHQFAGVFTYGPYVMGGSVVVDNASNSGSTVTWGRKDTVVSTDSTGTSLVSGDGTVIEIGGGGGSSTFAGLSDKTSVDIPATNTPTANALALKAPLASPTFTGTPAAPTAAKGTNTTQVATTAFVIERTGGASAVVDAIDLTLTSSHADTNRAPSGALTYTVNASTGWAVGEGMVVWLPTSGVLTFAVSGGPTINGGTSSITRALLDNAGGYVVLSRIQGSSAYAVTGF